MKNKLFYEQLSKKILILDGAMGTMLQQKGLKAEDFGGPELEGCNEILNITRPEIILSIHEAYLKAGADIIETNSFGGSRVVLAEYCLENRDMEINRAAAELARQAADRWSDTERPRFVAGSMGPTTKMLSLTGGITFAELEEAFFRQALGLLKGGVDLLLVETCQDTLNVKAAGVGINKAFEELKVKVPVLISCTVEPSGTMLAGQNIEAFYVSVQHLEPLAMGLNCGTGAELMNDSLRTLDSMVSCAVSCYPNAGLPDEEGIYQEEPQEFASKMARFAANGWLNIAGGCCGTTDAHIAALAQALAAFEPRKRQIKKRSCVSGLEAVWPEEENRPVIVGERSNVIGSRKFRDLIAAEKWDEGSEIARAQVKKGAQVIDICVANPDRNELEDMNAFLPRVANKIRAPLMLDSTDAEVLEAGLRLTQGKAVINSINLENGRQRFDEVVPLIKKYGAAVVVGVIDEQGMAISRERKLEVAERSYNLLVGEYGIPPADIIFDPLTFPVGTGDSKYVGSAVETIEGLRLIKNGLPESKTILGISNVSFGLPSAGREVLNAVFVYLNTLAGLDYAIVNAEKSERYATIPAEEKKLAEELLLKTCDQTLKAFTEFYREKKVVSRKQSEKLSVEERLAQYIIEGSTEGLEEDLRKGLVVYSPLEIINGPLLKGMEEVGSLFNKNQLIVAEVLQSAEIMKKAVDYLEPYMEKAEAAVKGKILLATVKGDVHDIGKNLVEIILANNGYCVINLGVKVSSEQLIEAAKREKPDVIGLSGLLVKSVQQMLLTAQDLKDAGIEIPLILGGAALSRKFTEEKIARQYNGPVLYAKDAMDSLTILKDLKISTVKVSEEGLSTTLKIKKVENGEGIAGENVSVKHDRSQNTFSSSKRQLMLDYPLEKLIGYLDYPKIIKRYLGVKNKSEQTKSATIARMEEFEEYVKDLISEIQQKRLIRACGVYDIFPVRSSGNSIYILDSVDQETTIEEFRFSRLKKGNIPYPANLLGIFAVTAGAGVKEQAENYSGNGQYLKSFLFEALALELVEAYAEHMQEKILHILGFPKERGIRFSPGYPILPDLGNQKKIFELLRPEDAGIVLTESMMMEPEASVSSLVFVIPKM